MQVVFQCWCDTSTVRGRGRGTYRKASLPRGARWSLGSVSSSWSGESGGTSNSGETLVKTIRQKYKVRVGDVMPED